MSEALVLKYRPQKFQDIVGNRLSGIVLQNMVELKQVPHALLFSGPSGVGKTTTARILAAEIQASDVIEVDAASAGGVDAIRSLIDVTRYSTGGGQRILILDEALALDTPLPTPSGWTTMGEVRVGDALIGREGAAVRVLRKTEVLTDEDCYRVS